MPVLLSSLGTLIAPQKFRDCGIKEECHFGKTYQIEAGFLESQACARLHQYPYGVRFEDNVDVRADGQFQIINRILGEFHDHGRSPFQNLYAGENAGS